MIEQEQLKLASDILWCDITAIAKPLRENYISEHNCDELLSAKLKLYVEINGLNSMAFDWGYKFGGVNFITTK